MESVLVTGAAGFIGSHVAKAFLDKGYRVVTIDNLSTGKESCIPVGCEFIKADCGDPNTIKLLEQRADQFKAIVHIAGQSSGEVSFENPLYDLQTNAQSTLLLLQFARRIQCRHFVYASSMSTYGDHPENPCVSEESPTVPKSFYAVGKLASENYMRIFSANFGIACVALRFFNVYGVGQNLDNLKQGMASIYLAMAINDRHVFVKGDKTRFRDFVYVSDVVDAVLRATNVESGYSFYNVSTCVATTVEKVIDEIKNNLPFDISVEYGAGTPGDQHGIYGENVKIKDSLGWAPKIGFKEGMKKMVQWALS